MSNCEQKIYTYRDLAGDRIQNAFRDHCKFPIVRRVTALFPGIKVAGA
jgi:hypothetical protein